jgi:helix-turn-helix protein
MTTEKVLYKYQAEMIVPAEKNVVQYPKDSRAMGLIVISDSRLIFKNAKSRFAILFKDINRIQVAPPGWCPGEENWAFAVECSVKGDRYKIVAYVNPSIRDLVVRTIRMMMINGSNIYFKYPAMKGGVMDRSDKWTKGKLFLQENIILLVGKEKKVKVPYQSIINYGHNLYVGDSRGMPTITIINHEEEEEVGVVIIGESHTLSTFENFLKEITDSIELGLDLGDELNQVLMILNSGVTNEEDIAEIIGIPVKDVERLMDKLIDMKLVKLVRIRRDVELTRSSIRYLNQVIKDGFG